MRKKEDALPQWSDALRLEIEPIDSQHRHLLNLLQQLGQEIEQQKNGLLEKLWSVVDYAYLHLDQEEQMMAHCNYSGLQAHLVQHLEFQQMLMQFMAQVEQQESSPQQYLQFTAALRQWWVSHISEVDRSYVSAVTGGGNQEHGPQSEPQSGTAAGTCMSAEMAIEVNRAMRQQHLATLARNIELNQTVARQRAESEMLLNAMGDGLVVADRQGRIRKVNPKLEQLTGRTEEELLQQPVGTLFEEEEEEEEVTGEVQKLFQSRLQHLHDHDHEAFHRLLIEAPIPLLVFNRETVQDVPAAIFLASHELEQLLGYPEGALQGRSLFELLPDQDRQRLQQRISRAEARLLCIEEKRCHWLHADGHQLESTICLLQIKCGDRQHVIIQIRTEQTLSRDLLAITPFGRVLVEEEEEELHLQRRLSNRNGEPVPVALNGSLLYTHRGTTDGALLVLHDLSEHKRLEQREQYAAFQSGVAEMSAHILHNVGNTIQGMDACEGELVEQLKTLQQVQSLYSQFLQNLEQAEAGEDPQAQEAARETMITAGRKLPAALLESVINPATEQLKTLSTGISHIKEVIRAQQKGVKIDTHAVLFPLTDLFEDLRLLSEGDTSQRAIALIAEIAPSMPEVRLPRNQLLQAMINLVKNSAESIDERIQAKKLPANGGEIRVRASLDETQLRLEVADNGNGIAPEIHDNLLRFGFTTKDYGSGFGLHAIGNFVGSIGGTIRIESEGVGQGATVVITLPLPRIRGQ